MAGNVQKANWQRQPLLINPIIIKLLTIRFSGSRTCSSNERYGESPLPLLPSLSWSLFVLILSFCTSPCWRERRDPPEMKYSSVILGARAQGQRGLQIPCFSPSLGSSSTVTDSAEDSWSLGLLSPLLALTQEKNSTFVLTSQR